MSAASGEATVLAKNLPELDPTKSRYPSLNYTRSRIELASVLAVMTLFWRIHCIGNRGEESESESFWPVSVEGFPDLLSRIFFYTLATFGYFFFYFNLIIYPPAILPCSQNWEKVPSEWLFWLEGKLMMDVRATLRFLSNVDVFSCLLVLVQTV